MEIGGVLSGWFAKENELEVVSNEYNGCGGRSPQF